MSTIRSVLLAAAATLAATNLSSAAIVYGGATETSSRFNPGQAGVVSYMNCFVDTTAGGVLDLNSVAVGIRRIASAGSLTAVDVRIYVAEMTYDGGLDEYGLGTQYDLGTFNLAGGAGSSVTQIVTANALGTSLNLQTVPQPGLGGFWVGVEFLGANATNANNGWRVVNAPAVGASFNAFGMYNYNASGVFESFFAFGTPPGSSPSRFMVDVDGTIVPVPGALALLGVAGVVAGRRRRA